MTEELIQLVSKFRKQQLIVVECEINKEITQFGESLNEKWNNS